MTARKRGVFEFDADASTEAVSEAVIEAVASMAETEPLDLEPLHSFVDPDALDALFALPGGNRREEALSVTFPYAGYEVTVWNHGRIHITES